MVKVEIDEGSGFCFGVVTAIHKAEEELTKGVTLYCLGDIGHNSREVERLKENFGAGSIVLSAAEVADIDAKLDTMNFDVFGGHTAK